MWADLSVFSKLQYLLTTEKTPHLHLILSLSYVMRYETTHIIVYCQNTYQWRPSSPDQRRWHSLLELVAVGTSDEFKWSAVAPHLQIITWWYHTGCNVFWCSNLASIEMAISYCKVHVTWHQESIAWQACYEVVWNICIKPSFILKYCICHSFYKKVDIRTLNPPSFSTLNTSIPHR